MQVREILKLKFWNSGRGRSLLSGVACGLLPLLISGCNGAAAAKPDDPAPVVTVEMAKAATQPMETTVSAQGTLAAAQGAMARVAPVTAGRVREVRVREGDIVREGQILVLLDSRSQEAQARSAAAALTAAESQAREADLAARASAADQSNSVRLARLALQSARIDRDNSVRQARTALATAQTDLKRIRAGARPQEIAQADQTVRQDQATRDRAEIEVRRMTTLFNRGIAAGRQLEDAQAALVVAEATLEGAKQQADLLRAGARPEEIHNAELAVQQANHGLTQAITGGDAKVAQAEAALQQAEQSALQVAVKRQDAVALRQLAAGKRADLATAQVGAGYAVLRAPLSGVVTRRALNPGDMADPAVPIIEITDTHALNLLANLTGQDGALVRPGMRARVTTPASPGQTFSGTVLSVGQVDPLTGLLALRIAVLNPQGKLRSGDFATADVVLRIDPKAVVVPKEAIVNHEKSASVFVVGADNVAHQRDVALGAERDGKVEILKGVSAGDQVVQQGPFELADGAKVKEAEHAQAAGGEAP